MPMRKIADWAIAKGLPFACSDKTACAEKFINEFAYKAFRRPLQDDVNGALEVSGFKELFSKAPSPQTGLRWAIVATLISPNFTYRSEQGIPAADARAKGWGKTNTSTSASDYEAVAGGVSVKVLHLLLKVPVRA